MQPQNPTPSRRHRVIDPLEDVDNPSEPIRQEERTLFMPPAQIFVVFGGFLILLIQIVTKNYNYRTPGDLLQFFANHAVTFFTEIGKFFGYMSGVLYQFIKLQFIADAIYELLHPMKVLLLSPYSFIRGIIWYVQNNDYVTSIIALGSGTFVTIFTILYSENYLQDNLKPSYIMTQLADYARRFYNFVGSTIAYLCNFYSVFKLDKLATNAYIIGKPTLLLMISPIFIAYGYIESIRRNSLKKMSLLPVL